MAIRLYPSITITFNRCMSNVIHVRFCERARANSSGALSLPALVNGQVSGSLFYLCQQLFKETSDLFFAINEMNFQNPMPLVSVCIG